MTQMPRKESDAPEQEQTAKELETLRIQINQIREQVNHLSQISSEFSPRSLSGLRTLGTVLYFFFLPMRWLRRLLFLLLRLMWRLKDFYLTGLYWFWFARVMIQDIGLKQTIISLWHPQDFYRSIGLRE